MVSQKRLPHTECGNPNFGGPSISKSLMTLKTPHDSEAHFFGAPTAKKRLPHATETHFFVGLVSQKCKNAFRMFSQIPPIWYGNPPLGGPSLSSLLGSGHSFRYRRRISRRRCSLTLRRLNPSGAVATALRYAHNLFCAPRQAERGVTVSGREGGGRGEGGAGSTCRKHSTRKKMQEDCAFLAAN